MTSLSPIELTLLAFVGAASGWINVVAGGGSALTVPLMALMGMPGPIANGTNRVAVIAQNLAAITAFFRGGIADFRLSASLSGAACIGAYFGAVFGVDLQGESFDRVVAASLIATGLWMAFDAAPASEKSGSQRDARNLTLGHALMIGAGFWGGLIQIGVGYLLMPILHRVMGLDLVRVNAHKVFIVMAFSLVALSVFAAGSAIDWIAGAALALGNLVGGWFGARATMLRGGGFIRKILFASLVVLIVALLAF